MRINRRDWLKLSGGASLAAMADRMHAAVSLPLTAGPFQGTRASLQAYVIPEWFRDAKFGIWAHWGPQSGVEDGDWYARLMYIQDSPQYLYHVEHFGHPTKVGYKDVIPLFKAANWDPDHLVGLYKAAGAKYFVSMGVHHDNYDMWNSKFQPRWNAVATGPKRDIVNEWKIAARRQGLKFGVSEHLSNSFDWLAPAHTADKTGPLAGVPYDGTLPEFADLYHSYAGMPANFAETAEAMGRADAPTRWKMEYFHRIKDLIDQHTPDLLYTDGGIPFDEYGLTLVAESLNVSAAHHDGKVGAIYTSKTEEDCETGTCVLDRERATLDGIRDQPWQTDTCIGGWHYKRGIKYKSAKRVIDMLVDIVSKNGNLLLNFPLPNDGVLDYEERVVLDGITRWMAMHGQVIYATRPWKIYGSGPSTKLAPSTERFNEDAKPYLTAEDFRFVTLRDELIVFMMGWRAGKVLIAPLGSSAPTTLGRIASVTLVGRESPVPFLLKPEGLELTLPSQPTSDIAVAFRVRKA
jgi:alpha-L-fucosidase